MIYNSEKNYILYDLLHRSMSLYPVDLTKLNILWTSLKRSAGLRRPNERAKLRGIVGNGHGENISEAEHLAPNSRRESSL